MIDKLCLAWYELIICNFKHKSWPLLSGSGGSFSVNSQLSPVIGQILMEGFQRGVINSSQQKPKHWYGYVDDPFVIWPHSRETLVPFQTI